MSSKSVLVGVLAVAAALCAQAVYAQASAPLSRAQVKEETKAAEKAGQLTPAGQGGAPVSRSAATGPTKTRAERKAETQAARKAGSLTPAGEGQARKADVADAARAPTKTREQRKAETIEAKKKGELVPAGQGSPAPTK